jgi:hypothetical protein
MRVSIVPGQRVRVVACYSEVNMHMGIAGKPMMVELVKREYPGDSHVYYSAQFYTLDGKPFSGTVTTGEGGLYRDGDTFTTDEDFGPGDENPRAKAAELTSMLEQAIGGVDVMVITSLGL